MNQSGIVGAANAGPDVVERNLRSWSWATGGWAAFHAGLAVVALLMGAPVNLATPTLRLLGGLVVAAWATAAMASWAFRRSLRMRMGLVAAGASLVAGVVLPFVGEAGSGAILDGIAHGFAGLGLAAALWRARAMLEDQ